MIRCRPHVFPTLLLPMPCQTLNVAECCMHWQAQCRDNPTNIAVPGVLAVSKLPQLVPMRALLFLILLLLPLLPPTPV